MTQILGTRKLTRLGLLTAMALILFLVEATLPRPLPWMKLGLGNAAVLAALLLFGAVQLTMMAWGLWQGERIAGWRLLGLAIAVVGLVVLLLPGLAAPPTFAAALMLGAGAAWGVYSLLGRDAGEPIAAQPDVIPVVKEADQTSNCGGNWPTVAAYLERPSLGSVLYSRQVPALGGDTLWANQYAAYEALSDGMKELLEGLKAVHSAGKNKAELRLDHLAKGTETARDAARGREIAAGRQANCLACHHMPIPEQPFHGDLGPDLAGVADRLTEGALRLRLVDPKRIGEASVMPAFYRVHGLTRVARRYRDRPILAAQQVEDVIAYLMTLTEP